jgi:hypothetical protein
MIDILNQCINVFELLPEYKAKFLFIKKLKNFMDENYSLDHVFKFIIND